MKNKVNVRDAYNLIIKRLYEMADVNATTLEFLNGIDDSDSEKELKEEINILIKSAELLQEDLQYEL